MVLCSHPQALLSSEANDENSHRLLNGTGLRLCLFFYHERSGPQLSQRNKCFILLCAFIVITGATILWGQHFARLVKPISSNLAGNSDEKVIINLAVAANFKPTLKAILAAYKEKNYDNPVQFNLISGSTGALYSQIRQGAPFDLFFAADIERPFALINEQLTVDATVWVYAIGQLALVFPKLDHAIDAKPCPTTIASPAELLSLIDKNLSGSAQREYRLSIANPTTAPYGAAAMHILNSLPTSHPLKTWQLIMGKNILHSQQHLLTKHADMAILSSAMAHQASMQRFHFCKLSRQLYPKIEQAMVKINPTAYQASRQQAISTLLKFMTGDDATSILSNHNYLTTPYSHKPQ